MATLRRKPIREVGTSVPASLNPKEKETKMKVANCVINLGQCTVPKAGVTPAELMLLKAEHHKNAKGQVVVSVEETGEIERTAPQEAARLKGLYGKKKVEALFPGFSPVFPADFAEVKAMSPEGITLPGNILFQDGALPDGGNVTSEMLKGE